MDVDITTCVRNCLCIWTSWIAKAHSSLADRNATSVNRFNVSYVSISPVGSPLATDWLSWNKDYDRTSSWCMVDSKTCCCSRRTPLATVAPVVASPRSYLFYIPCALPPWICITCNDWMWTTIALADSCICCNTFLLSNWIFTIVAISVCFFWCFFTSFIFWFTFSVSCCYINFFLCKFNCISCFFILSL